MSDELEDVLAQVGKMQNKALAERITALLGAQKSAPKSLAKTFDQRLATMVLQERMADYGHPSDNFALGELLATPLSACKDPELRYTLRAIQTKVARLVNTPSHFDSWLDIAGYARCALMILDRRAGHEE